MAEERVRSRHFTWAASRLHPAVTGGERYDLEVVQQMQRWGVQIHEFEIAKLNKHDHLSCSLALRKHLKITKDSLVLFDFGPHNQYLPAALWHHARGGKIAALVHHLSHPLKPNSGRIAFDKALSIIFLRLCHLIFVSSKDTRKAVLELELPAGRISVVYPALGVLPPQEPLPWHLPQPPYKLLYVGYFKKRKGFDLLLDVVAKLPQQQFTLTAVGDETIDDAYATEMHRRAVELSIPVRFLGRLEPGELSKLYLQHDLLVHPARHEGFGMTLLEAQAHGLPVVAFRVGAIPEVVTDGAGGVLIPPFDTARFASEVIKLMQDAEAWQRQRRAGLARAGSFVGWERPSRQIYDLLMERRLI